MPEIPQIVATIDNHLNDLAAEITALVAAKAALAAPSPSGEARATAADTPATRTRRRQVRRSSRARKSATVKSARQRRAGIALRSETLELLLADTAGGLSANAISERAGAGYNPTLKLLRELEASGRVRRTGARRTTMWRLITDEERIAERVAELESRRRDPSQRRRRVRAS